MYQNHIRRTTPKITPNSHPHFFIRRSEIAFDNRVAYVESVCGSLLESRFGPRRVMPVTVNWSDRPELESAVFFDLLDDCEMMPCYALSPQGRTGYQAVEAAYRRAKQMELLDAGPTEHNSTVLTPNQGRGSPQFSGTQDPSGGNASVNERASDKFSGTQVRTTRSDAA